MSERGIARLKLILIPRLAPPNNGNVQGQPSLNDPFPGHPVCPPMRVLDNHMFRLRMANNHATETRGSS